MNKTLSCALSMVCFYFISYTLHFFHDRHISKIGSHLSPRTKNTAKCERVEIYTLFQSGRHFSVLLFACKLALVASFKGKYSFEFQVFVSLHTNFPTENFAFIRETKIINILKIEFINGIAVLQMLTIMKYENLQRKWDNLGFNISNAKTLF